ncbi:hypothetical protein C0583_01935 [Candidatus Parcubacteria bacterium]|nr:MAG: hypothetical protein C0583_01935 [Candidatus Parcubacteria bacterium]
MLIQKIPGKMASTWEEDSKAVLDTWETYDVSLDEFKDAILNKGINFIQGRGAVAWIVDSTKAKGVFSQEIQDFIGSDIFPAFVNNGIKYFITIKPEVANLTSLTVSNYAAKAGPAGMKLVDVKSVADAKMWLRENADKK